MKISVKVHPNSSQEKIKKINEKVYEMWIKEKPMDGKANAILTKLLKKYFNSEVKLVSGFNSRNKILEVME
ncbi:hypothetical protein COU59_01570 [Candidatus Pacearchaeota archaeon CG10_big_fil_rev_8_21_14_0_10_34_12]|nr:MAG: hypothetical protein COU59_01570 [Candidatus Pacearchaeota archaeon CG10_big_fil_rev_8_21_14_0_10_34_12]